MEADTISASPGFRPQCSHAPRPCSPSTPSAKDSSTTSRYLHAPSVPKHDVKRCILKMQCSRNVLQTVQIGWRMVA